MIINIDDTPSISFFLIRPENQFSACKHCLQENLRVRVFAWERCTTGQICGTWFDNLLGKILLKPQFT